MPPRKRKHKTPKRPPRKSKSTPLPRVPHGPGLHVGSVGPAFQKLVATMARLRAPNGCPWDREQTHATLRTYLLEESYEVLDALESSDDAKFSEELGDLLLQILFHAQIAHEENRFDISNVISALHEKLIRRHPHVFGKTSAKNSAEVLHNWEQIKLQERQSKAPVAQGESALVSPPFSGGSPARPELRGAAFSSSSPSSPSDPNSASLLDNVPRTLPALLEAYQLTRKAARIGFDWHNLDGIFAKLLEETGELRRALAQRNQNPSAIESEVGDILFVAVNLARFLNLDPEIALKKSNSKFSRRFREMERLARAQGTTLAQLPRPQMESLWNQSKLLEHSASTHEPPK